MSHVMSRRSAARGAAVVAVGGLAGFVLARNSSAANQPAGTTAANAYGAGSSGGGQALASLASIPQGGGTIVRNPPVVIVRSGPDTVHAFSAICTHQGCAVTTIANGKIECPCHGSEFDLASGKVVAGPAPAPLPPIAVTVRSGEVYRT